ncbi:MAG: hypothetical protein JXX29_16455 [Deltaproteobacteria bacterium]|nr:hypothetical protein [Deltaproteobacteria bacterium]MBN2673276.1 hypothetical protein [Deltaproteobacteria bacterium]
MAKWQLVVVMWFAHSLFALSATAAEPQNAASSDAPGRVGYAYGLYLETADERFLLKFNGMFKLRYTYLAADVSESARKRINRFSNPNAVLLFSGHLFTRKLTFTIFPDFGLGQFKVAYIYFLYELKKNRLYVRVGQGKKPYGRHYLTSPIEKTFVLFPSAFSYAKTGLPLGYGIDIGVEFSNNFMASRPGVEWAVGLFNGTNAMPVVRGTVHPSITSEDGQLVPVEDAPIEEVTVTNYP